MKLLLVDDHELFRAGLKFILEDFEESVQFLEASSTEDAAGFQNQRIDLILLDLGLHGLSGLDALDAIRTRFTDATIVVLSSDEDPVRVRLCIEQGASGYIPKSSSQDVMIQALRLVLAGGIYLPPLSIGHYPARRRTDPGSSPAEDATYAGSRLGNLSPRQLDALMLAVQGKSNKLIARELSIAEGTVKLHMSAAYRALGVSNRTEAVYVAAEMGLRAPPDR